MSNLVTSFFYLLHHMRLCTAPYRFQIRCRLKGNALISYYVNGSGSITSVGEERADLSAAIYL